MFLRWVQKRGATNGLALLSIAYAVQENHAESDECGLYMAPSTIPNAGLGIFTAKPLEVGDFIGNGDIAIPIVDQDRHRKFIDGINIMDEYVWQGWTVGMQFESGDFDEAAVSGFIPGLDAAMNCNAALLNADFGRPQYDISLHRSRHAGAGAITSYHNGTTKIIADVPAGGEIFKYYGDEWFDVRSKIYGEIPFIGSYEDAQAHLYRFSSFDLSSKAKKELWGITRGLLDLSEPTRISNAFPHTYKDAIQAIEQGIRSLHQPSAIRSVEWMKIDGRCMDSIRPQTSTIEGAGRGAFATRSFDEGEIVTGSPLIHLPYSDELTFLHNHYLDKHGDLQKDHEEVAGMQLFINYCYGHVESTLLLCPYGAGVNYINHNSSRANVKIQWTPNGVMSQADEWFNRSLEWIEENYKIGLAFDFVATRDILPGEEILLNYGPEWEEAWNQHLREWKPPDGAEDYEPAFVWNTKYRDKPIRTELEQEIEPYPENVRILCRSTIGSSDEVWPDEWVDENSGIDCNILYRSVQDGEMRYEIELPNFVEDGLPVRLADIPRGAIKFVDEPYSSDMHLENAFRHHLMIPDDMFPEEWKNVY